MKSISYWLAFCLLVLSSIRPVIAQGLLINEVMSSNLQSLEDEDDETPDWIEIYNSSNTTIDLSNYSISDKATPEESWTFPSFQLGSGRYHVVFASGKDRKGLPLYWKTIIKEGDNWNYLVPSAELPSNWNEVHFNDQSWKTGPSGFGYGDNDDNTVLPNIRSVFIRKSFEITSPSDIEEAILHMDYDDAFVAYINGTEVARANISTNGAPAFNAKANNDTHEARMYSGGVPDEFEIEKIQSVLHEGANVLAIQVHNGTDNSSDLTAIPFLSLGYTSPVEGDVVPFLANVEKKFHTDFKISSEGESLYLFKQGNLEDSVSVPALSANISYGRNLSHENNWFYYKDPTPGAHNNSKAYTDFSGDVHFSVPGGSFNSSFSLSLSSDAPTDDIYYTTDYTEPTLSDHKYTGPITLSSTTMLRAKVINPDKMPGLVSTQSYFFNLNHDLPVVSLVTDPDNFFGYENGIYVNGPGHPRSGENCDNGTNFWQDWEVPVHVTMIEKSGRLAFEQNAGVKIFGGCSRNNAQKSLSLRFRKQYGKDGLEYKVFNDLDITTFHSLNLRSSGNDWNQTMFRDGLQMNLFPESIDKMAFRPAVVYINGDYWGIHNIRERIDQYYLASHHNVDPESINLMEFHVNWLVNLVEGDDQHYLDLLAFINNNDLAAPENYDYVCSQMDVENFALYQAAQICIKNTDWPGNNVKYWQSDELDMRWRWIAFDLDFGFTDVNHNTLLFALEENNTGWPNPAQSTLLLRQLNKNRDFRNLFINAFADELNVLWDEDHLHQLIDDMKSEIASEIPKHFQRWGGNSNAWPGNSNGFYSFASQRPKVVRRFVKDYYALSGTYTLDLDISDTNQGTIKVNSIQPTTYPWEGLYYNNIPITLKAVPKHGYRFVKWEGAVNNSRPTIEVSFNQTTSIKAIFEKIDLFGTVVINELFFNNVSGNTPEDWVEIFNNNSETVDLSGWTLKDSNDDHEFVFDANTFISPYDYLVVCKNESQFNSFYTPGKNTVGDLPFGLSSTEDCVRLYNKSNYLMDSVGYYNSQFDSTQSFTNQRFTDRGDVEWSSIEGFGTPAAKNDFTNTTEETALEVLNELQVYPNPFTKRLEAEIQLSKPGTLSIKLMNQNGAIVHQKQQHAAIGTLVIELENMDALSNGIYVLLVQTQDEVLSQKVIKR